MRRTTRALGTLEKAILMDQMTDILIECQNNQDKVSKEEMKHYGNACGMAGYKIMRLLYESHVVESGIDGKLNV